MDGDGGVTTDGSSSVDKVPVDSIVLPLGVETSSSICVDDGLVVRLRVIASLFFLVQHRKTEKKKIK